MESVSQSDDRPSQTVSERMTDYVLPPGKN